MDMKYYIGILCAVILVIGSMIGTFASAADNAGTNKIAKTMSMEKAIEIMEAKGFDLTVKNDVIYAHKEYKKEGYDKAFKMAINCPGGECQFQKPEKEGMDKKHSKFRMHGTMDMEAVKEKMISMGYGMEAINEKMAGMAKMEHKGFKGCPMHAVMD